MDARKTLHPAAVAFTSLIVGATAAQAGTQNNQQPLTVLGRADALIRVVSVDDLSLATKQGRNALERRVSDAVGEVCPDGAKLNSFYDVDDCRAFAWHGARPQMKRAIALAKSGQLLAMTIQVSAAG
jgi:UrcA family protein